MLKNSKKIKYNVFQRKMSSDFCIRLIAFHKMIPGDKMSEKYHLMNAFAY